jgi:hypothetical protein
MIRVFMKIAVTCGAILKMANGMIGLVIIMENPKQLCVKSFFNVCNVINVIKYTAVKYILLFGCVLFLK